VAGVFKQQKSFQLNRSLFRPSYMVMYVSCVLTETLLFEMQAAEMGFLQNVRGVALRDKVRSFEIRKALNVELLPSE